MKFLGKKMKTVAIVALSCASTYALACTDFRVTASDGTVIITRSQEYSLDLKSNLRSSNRDRKFVFNAADGKPGLSWNAKYGYVFLDALEQDVAVDGMNEKGLSFEALYLPGLAQYQTVPAGKDKQALPYINIGDWILSNFDSVDQVKQALPNIYVYNQSIPGMDNMTFPLHFAIYDATGKGIVVEYVGGTLHVYDNQIGVMTNSPSYDWHITNLYNYVHLTPENPAGFTDNNINFASPGQGFGMVGLPGDITPPSRFVKTATLMRTAIQPSNAADALNLAVHVINNVDIPLGFVRENQNGKTSNEYTQWVVFKDLTNKQFYFRTYADLALRSVDLNKIDFAATAKRLLMPIERTAMIDDETAQFNKATTQPAIPAPATPAA